ncbi:MAG TPA: hypothetical protein VJ744_00680 [Gaiellaceae bacterium]|nr:hypothetical protein [Gaiellaceae bacterium]
MGAENAARQLRVRDVPGRVGRSTGLVCVVGYHLRALDDLPRSNRMRAI